MFGRGRGFGGFRERFFDRGDLKYVILELLRERPRHGYDIIRALEDRFHGAYRPSPGSVYPTLQMLEDGGYVTSEQVDGKRVYTITDAGIEALRLQAAMLESYREMLERFFSLYTGGGGSTGGGPDAGAPAGGAAEQTPSSQRP